MASTCLYGASAGDIIGSRFEGSPHKSEDFQLFHPACRFTDDTVLTLAVAAALLDQLPYRDALLRFGRRYPYAGYGGSFRGWLRSPQPQPYNSFGNGSAMRASPVGWAFDSLEQVLQEAEATALPSHNHPEGIKGAQAAALAVFLARREKDKAQIRRELAIRFRYDLTVPLAEIRTNYTFDVTCQGTLPPALTAFLESLSFEDAVRKAVSLGGDADTLAAITGSIAEAYYGGVPASIQQEVRQRLPADLQQVLDQFNQHFLPKGG